ncbi:MAG: L-fucose/L-arabinose isomerase family protein [Sedimentisphaeraceae bacterium JB056]
MRKAKKSTFALLLGNRGFFPAELITQARKELINKLESLGHKVIMPDENTTRHGAVSDNNDARVYAEFLEENKDKYDGIIISLPNFGDESSAINAVKSIEKPILIHAYPDDLDKMSPEYRRDSFCGKFSVMDVFYQYGRKFTALKPHVANPNSSEFTKNIRHFDIVCRIVGGFENMVVGAIGARTSAFKTVRVDELALQQNGITMEVMDLSEIFKRMDDINPSADIYKAKSQSLKAYTNWGQTPDASYDKLVRLGVILDSIFDEINLDAMALRCWIELQRQLNVSACVLLSEMNDRKLPVACEVDVANAISMYALYLATDSPTACLDWNNNYGSEQDKCILFHCGSTAQSLMTSKGEVVDHSMLQHDPQVGPNCSFGCNEGRIKAFPFAFSSMTTRNGKLDFYLGEGEFTNDPIPADFFGCGGVAKIDSLEDVLLYVGKNGHRHHVSVAPGSSIVPAVYEALSYYLGFDVSLPQNIKL